MGVKKALADANYTYMLVQRYLSCTIHVAVSVDLKFCFHIYLFLFILGFLCVFSFSLTDYPHWPQLVLLPEEPRG